MLNTSEELTTMTSSDNQVELQRRAELVGWVMRHVDDWRKWRDNHFAHKWAEYYRLWRGFWAQEDKNRDSERSKLISPALQQAIEMTVAEMEEATFGRGEWIDISDSYEDQEKAVVTQLRDQLITDLEFSEVPASVCEAYINGALYGTGLGKVMIGRYSTGPLKGQFHVWLDPISPTNFVIDPAARSIDEALGCAHELSVPSHRVYAKQRAGVYYKETIGSWVGEKEMFDMSGAVFVKDLDSRDIIYITEYHGLVPKKFTKGNFKLRDQEDPIKDENGIPLTDDGEMVEMIVTIANKGTLLRDVENPFTNKDRSIIGYQHETVPNQFWGRGVAEKGYNPQKALDAELRARMDALGLLTHPVMGADATRLPRGLDLKIRPGKLFLLNGRPSEILEPITFGNLDPSTFQNTSDLERMVQMGTGAMDSATPLDTARRNETSGGMSQMQAGFIKRAKRTMQNVERQFLTKFVQKALWRYMQFDGQRYPTDFKFLVRSSMGIMAREVEQQVLAQLIQTVPPESPIYPLIIKGIIENGASPNKAEMLKALDQAMQPNPQQQQFQQQMQNIQMQTAQAELDEKQAKAAQHRSAAILNMANAKHAGVQAETEPVYAQIQAKNAEIAGQKIGIEHARLHHDHFETMLDHHNQQQDRMVEVHKINKQSEQAKANTNKPKPNNKK
jgi:hypothetical protein